MITPILDISKLRTNKAIRYWIMVLHKSKYNRTRGALPDRYLRLTHWNIGGLISDAHGNKIEDPDFLRLVKDEDILALTETHIGEDVELSMQIFIFDIALLLLGSVFLIGIFINIPLRFINSLSPVKIINKQL